MLDIKLLNILACPDCQSDVIYKKTGSQETLVCSQCQRVFKVKDGIPMMLPKSDSK